MWDCCPCFKKTYEAPEILELDYRHSSLSEVPNDVFSFERTLERLDLGSNQITDLPPSLFHCHELKELDLCDNDLMSIPPAIGSFTHLVKLDLSRNSITDVSDSIKNCKSLVYFDLSMNHLTKLPEGISQLVNLEELFLNDTYLEFLHANFGRLTKLRVLEIRENSIQSLPKSMSRLNNLQRLDIGQNDLSELPEVIFCMSSLNELWCDNNSVRFIPKSIGNLPKLNCLDVSQNEIQGIADEISKCTQLSDVTLNLNGIETLPDSFVKLENLTVLRVDSNSIQYLPEEFGCLKNLQELSILSNILKALPSSIGLLRKLHTLYVDDNLLSELPKEIGSCTSLSVLSASKNRIKDIPSEIGHLSSLKVLSLAGNLIVHLPVSILNIPKLGALWLSESQSKPLLPMNKEIDPSTGQHVLTCYLLPQMPSTGENIRRVNPDDVPRRSRPSIKFVTDIDPVVVEPSVNRRGLLRAPTPYPKELRALAKHASNIRQSKEQNGDIANTDEPEYEGDYPEDHVDQLEPTEQSPFIEPSRNPSVQDNQIKNTPEIELGYNRSHIQPNTHLASTIKQENLGRPNFSTSTTSDVGLPSVPLLNINLSKSYTTSPANFSMPPQDHELEKGIDTMVQVNFTGMPDGPLDKSNREAYGNSAASDMARKSPPPYHVAARRAAFFRSSGGAGSGRVGSPDIQSHVRTAPLVGRVFPLPVSGQTIPQLHYSSSTGPQVIPSPLPSTFSQGNTEEPLHVKMEKEEIDDIAENDLHASSIIRKANQIFHERDDSDIVSSLEENLDTGSNMELTKVPIDSTNLVKTIETALESVDKRTTEFLRNDMWKQENTLLENESTDSFHSKGRKGENIVDSEISNNVPSSSKAPMIPPKPSPLINRSNDRTNDINDTNVVPPLDLSIVDTLSESSTKIPIMATTGIHSPTKKYGSHIPAATSSFTTDSKKAASVPFENEMNPENDMTDGNFVTPGSSLCGQSSISISSRIPKLPSLTGSISSISYSQRIVGGESMHAFQYKKPEILSPKPMMARAVTPSRIPSFGASDSKSKDFVAVPTVTKLSSKNASLLNNSSSFKNVDVDNTTSPNDEDQISNNNSSVIHNPAGSKIPRFGETSPDKQELKRSGSGTRIPKFNDNSQIVSPSQTMVSPTLLDNSTFVVENNNENQHAPSPAATLPGNVSKIPSIANKKPWIFGTHKNARVVSVEFHKVNTLGFTVNDAKAAGHTDCNGVYVIDTDYEDSTVKVGDKILQVDGIDVSNMSSPIVKKILSNCQETINLLVSRKS